MATWRMFVRSAALRTIAEVSDFQRFHYEKRRNTAGSWELSLNAGLEAANLLKADTPGVGLLVYRGSRQIMSGEVRNPTSAEGGADQGNIVEVEGIDDTGLMAERAVYPDPTGAPFDTWGDVRTGVLSTVLKDYVNVNLGPGALTARRAFGLVMGTDPIVGATVTGRGMWQNLIEFLQELALNSDLRFEIRHSAEGQREFVVSQAQNKTTTVRLSTAMGNVAEISHTRKWPTATHVIGAGQGEGPTRLYVEQDLNPGSPGVRRVEMVLDLPSIRFADELTQKVNEAIQANKGGDTYTLEPVETEDTQYGDDYELGDKVTAIVNGVSAEVTISAVTIDAGDDQGGGWKVKPVLQTAAGAPFNVE